jgi:hypothetical protein
VLVARFPSQSGPLDTLLDNYLSGLGLLGDPGEVHRRTDVREFERTAHTATYFRALTENSLACMDPACSDVKSNVPMLMLRNSRPCQLRRIIPVGE